MVGPYRNHGHLIVVKFLNVRKNTCFRGREGPGEGGVVYCGLDVSLRAAT